MSKTKKEAGEFVQFQMHPQLLKTVIRSQAGSVSKALIELVMNSVDARATRICLDFSSDTFTLEDDGCGFESAAMIREFFATFGTPHKEGDAVYGRFRLGRGQIFCFARTEWRSNTFSMRVDLAGEEDATKLGFEFQEHLEHAPGCRISGVFYERLPLWNMNQLLSELKQLLAFCPIPVIVNGTDIRQTPPKWDYEDERLLIAYEDTLRGTRFYNQGIYVTNEHVGSNGVSGIVVSKVGHPFDVIMARNQIQTKCPLRVHALRELKRISDAKLDLSANLTDAQRVALYRKLRDQVEEDGADSWLKHPKARKARIFKDCYGKAWSLDQIHRKRRQFEGGGRTLPIVAASRIDGSEDSCMQRHIAFVLDDQWLREMDDYLRIDGKDNGSKVFPDDAFSFPDPEQIKSYLQSSFSLIPHKQLNTRQRKQLEVIQSIWKGFSLGCEDENGQRIHSHQIGIRMGVCSSTDVKGWTDAHSYIAINAPAWETVNPGRQFIIEMVGLLMHEWIHIVQCENSKGTHSHDPATFHKPFHDLIQSSSYTFALSRLLSRRRNIVGRIWMNSEEEPEMETDALLNAVAGVAPSEEPVVAHA